MLNSRNGAVAVAASGRNGSKSNGFRGSARTPTAQPPGGTGTCRAVECTVAECGSDIIGSRIWKKYGKWPVYSKFFDNMGPIPHHMHQNAKQAKLVKQEGKPESYYFPPQHNNVGNNFPYTFMGLEPGTTKAEVRKCLEEWNKGAHGILDLSKAFLFSLFSISGWTPLSKFLQNASTSLFLILPLLSVSIASKMYILSSSNLTSSSRISSMVWIANL